MTQFYAMDVSVQDGSRVNAGSQDNNSLKSWQNDNTVNGDWIPYVGGDGMMNRIDPTNDRKFYGCSQNGGCRRFFPGTEQRRRHDDPGPAQELGRAARVRSRPEVPVRCQRDRLSDRHRAG